MKLKKEFVLSPIGEEVLLVPTGKESKRVQGMVRLNDSAAFIVRQFQQETTIPAVVDALLAEYDVGRDDALKYIEDIAAKLRELGAFEE